MSGQGYHLAIPKDRADRLCNFPAEDEVLDDVNDLLETMEASEPEDVHGGYKEWDVLHRCLSDGTFNPRGGTYPLNQCFIGGRLLVREGSIVNVVVPEVVQDVAAAVDRLDRDWFQARFTALFAREYVGAIPDEDCRHFYDRLHEFQHFYGRAAGGRKAVVFYTDDCLSYFDNPTADT